MTEEIKPASRIDIDLYVDLSLRRAVIKKSMEALRPRIEALGEGGHAGLQHSITIAKVSSSSLSVAVAKSLLTPAEIAQATNTTESLRITVDR